MERHRLHADEHLSGLQSRDREIVIENQSLGRFTLPYDTPSTLPSGDESRVGDICDAGRGHSQRRESKEELAGQPISPCDPLSLIYTLGNYIASPDAW